MSTELISVTSHFVNVEGLGSLFVYWRVHEQTDRTLRFPFPDRAGFVQIFAGSDHRPHALQVLNAWRVPDGVCEQLELCRPSVEGELRQAVSVIIRDFAQGARYIDSQALAELWELGRRMIPLPVTAVPKSAVRHAPNDDEEFSFRIWRYDQPRGWCQAEKSEKSPRTD